MKGDIFMQIGQVQIDLTQIILAVATLIFGLLMRYVIPMIKNKLDGNQIELLRIAVKTAVYAAEQLYGSKQGQEKLQYVIDLLYKQGFIVNKNQVEDSIRAMIESFVKELNMEQAITGA